MKEKLKNAGLIQNKILIVTLCHICTLILFHEPALMLPTAHSPSAPVDSVDNNITPDVLEKKKKRKKKRSHDDCQPDDTAKPSGQPNKKQKRKENTDNQDPVEEAPATVSSAMVTPAETDASLKKIKKKKKDKGKDKATPLLEQTDAEIEASSQASAAALLSAIVATMSNPPPQVQPPTSFNPHLPPPAGQPFMPFPFGFPLPSAVQNGAAHPNVFVHPPPPPGSNVSPSNNMPLSELALGSNDDVLRALQELDMSKLANTLKSLTEASSVHGATIPPPPGFPPQMSFMPPPSSANLPPPAGRQMPTPQSANEATPAMAKISVSSHGQKRTIDMSVPGNEQHTDPTHAHMLATKWMNASKLAEMVREQGTAAITTYQLKQI